MKKQIFGPILVIQADSGKIHLNLAHTSAKNRQYSTVLSMPEDAYADGVLNKPEEIEELLRNALKEKHLRKAKNVIFVLNSSRVLSERVLVQPTEDKWLGKMLETNRDTYFPVDTTNCHIVWTRVGTLNVEGEGERLLVQLWAVPEDLLKPYYQIANNLKLSVLSVDFCGNSFTEAIHATYADPNAPKSTGRRKRKEKRGKEKEKEAAEKEGSSANKSKGAGSTGELLESASENESEKDKKKGKKKGKEKGKGLFSPWKTETDEKAKKTERLYLLAERDYLLLTVVSGTRVVLQRYIQCGTRYPSELDEARLVMEGYLSRVSRRRAPEEAILCGIRAYDDIYRDQAEQSIGMPLTTQSSGEDIDIPQLLAEGAVRSQLDFGIPALNKPKKSRLAVAFWQYLLVLAGGGMLALALMTTIGARGIRALSLSSMQTMVDALTEQLAPISGYRDRWNSYLLEYQKYKADWEFLLGYDEAVGTDEETGEEITVYQHGALQTYNDNLSKVLGEIEQILPESASVTEIRIDEGAIALQLACEDKEEAAWLLTAFRYDLQYADLWPDYISNLTVGGGESVFSSGISAAIAQAMAAKNPAPAEGSAGEDDLAELLPDDLTEEQKAKILEIWSSMDLTDAQRQQLMEKWKTVTPEQWNSALTVWDGMSAAERETVKGIAKKTLAGNKNYSSDEISVAFDVAGRISTEDRRALASILGLNISCAFSLDELLPASSLGERKQALSDMMGNPFAAYELCILMLEDMAKDDSILFEFFLDDLVKLMNEGVDILAGGSDNMGALLPYLMEMPTAEEENVEATVRLIQTDSYLSSNYSYYLAVAMGRISGEPSQTNPGTNPGTPGTDPGSSPAPVGSQPPAPDTSAEPGPGTLPGQDPETGGSTPPDVQPTTEPEPTPTPTPTPNPLAGSPLESRWDQLQQYWPFVRLLASQRGINVDEVQWDKLDWDRFSFGMADQELINELLRQLDPSSSGSASGPSDSGQTGPSLDIPEPVIPTEPPDTRTYFTVVLVYKDALLQQELDRKVLPRDEMLPPLELEVEE